MPARTRKVRHDDETRRRIRTSQLINRLEGHVFGKYDMTNTQVSAALGLLRKTLPDLSQAEVNHNVKHAPADYTREELAGILASANAANGGGGIAQEDGRGSEPDSVH